MKYRHLGQTALSVSEIGHGTWAMGSLWGPRNDEQALAALHEGHKHGINFIDTAWAYGGGHSERLIGRYLSEISTPVYVATKCPPKNQSWPAKLGIPWDMVFPLDHLLAMTEKSLQNLKVDRIDLQQLHVWNPEWLLEKSFHNAVQHLKDSGMIRYFGVSLNDHQPDSGLELVKSGLVDSIQVIFNLFDQTPRERLFPLCLEHQVGVIARVPLDEGGLTGKLTPNTQFVKGDWRAHYFKGTRLAETCERAAQFNFLIQAPYRNLSQVALKFCLSEPAVSTAIPGMRHSTHVFENTEVSELSELSMNQLREVYTKAWPRNFYPSHG